MGRPTPTRERLLQLSIKSVLGAWDLMEGDVTSRGGSWVRGLRGKTEWSVAFWRCFYGNSGSFGTSSIPMRNEWKENVS